MIRFRTTQHIQITQKSPIVHLEPQATLDAVTFANQIELTTGNRVVQSACGQSPQKLIGVQCAAVHTIVVLDFA